MKPLHVAVLIFEFLFSITTVTALACNTGADQQPCDGIVNSTELFSYIDEWYKCSACVPDLFDAITAFFTGQAPCTNDPGCSADGDFCDGSMHYNCTMNESDGCLDRIDLEDCASSGKICVGGQCQRPPGDVYYVDANIGIDSCNTYSIAGRDCSGSDGIAFKTVQGAANVLTAGDTVYVREGAYHEEIRPKTSGSPGKYIAYLAYPGERPAVDASMELFGWKKCDSEPECLGNKNWSNIYYTAIPEGIYPLGTVVYEDDKLLKLAQDPNQPDEFYSDDRDHFIFVPGPTCSNVSARDPAYFTQSDPNYWDGAYVAYYGGNNNVVYKKIASFNPSNNEVFFEGKLPFACSLGYDRYSVLNHMDALDKPGEYHIDNSTGELRIFVWPSDAGNIDDNKITYSDLNNAFYLAGQGYLRIEGFEVRKQARASPTDYRGGTGFVNPAGFSGPYSNYIIRSNVIWGGKSSAITLTRCNNSVVENNTIYDQFGKGIILTSHYNTTIRKNYVRRTGSTAIDYYYTHHSNITNNTVEAVHGHHANGLTVYLYSSNILMSGNRVYGNRITLQNSHDITIERNLAGGISWWGSSADSYPENFTVKQNTFLEGLTIAGDVKNIMLKDNILGGYGENDQVQASHNLYTSLAWDQGELENTGIYDPDTREIFLDYDNLDYRLKRGVIVGEPPKTADPCYMSSAGDHVGAFPCIDCQGDDPVAIFDADKTSGYEILEVNFDASKSLSCDSEIKSYEWDFGDGGTVAGQKVSHSFNAGSYVVTLTVTNSLDKSNSVTKTINVLPSAVPNLVLYLSLDDTLYDFSGKDNYGEWRNGDGTFVDGVSGKAIYLDGTENGPYALVERDGTLSGMGELTISMWAKKSTPDSGGELLRKHTSYHIQLSTSSNNRIYPGLSTTETESKYPAITTENISNADWHHYALTYDGATAKFFVDGSSVWSDSYSGNVVESPTRDVYIGKDPWGNSFDGSIDDVMLYDRALTEQEISNIYNSLK